MKFPVITSSPSGFPPKSATPTCPVCGETIKGQIVYLSGGGVLAEFNEHISLYGFLSAGIHSSAVDCAGSAELEIVSNSATGSFDITFCSTSCLSRFFAKIVTTLENQPKVGS